MYNPGSIVFVDLGLPPSEVKGHEQGLSRPCLVLKDYPHLKLTTVIPFTAEKPRYAMFSVVPVPSATSILKFDSFALCHQVRTVSHNRIKRFDGMVSNEEFMRIRGVLFNLLF